jgi:hypothetical protein
VNASDQFSFVEWLGHIVVGAIAEALDLVLAERQWPKVFAIEFQQIESLQHGVGRLPSRVESIEHRDAIGATHTTASPSSVNDLARSLAAAAAMAGYLAVQS